MLHICHRSELLGKYPVGTLTYTFFPFFFLVFVLGGTWTLGDL